MSRYTKLAGWVLTFFLIGRVGAFIGDISLVKEYGPEVPAGIGKLWDGVRLILFKFSNVGAAIWLLLDARKDGENRSIWALMALVFGLVGLMLYFLVVIARSYKGSEDRNDITSGS
ncbi:hypothetical protein N9920_01500 [Akkermansiaceae bacterium]|nr:hypothetical protein [Akkermansiaceae bacterium]MDA8980831.1 hypothetical protein [bacterium]MDA7684267.1 hypothetical protein [Akkermansiaceae bacterium]MDA7863477.1 hypothetical protein [Akkermansiaceae bacterium]MDA8959810.1 hypothetical protein [Akkermansiaceae bacterium]